LQAGSRIAAGSVFARRAGVRINREPVRQEGKWQTNPNRNGNRRPGGCNGMYVGNRGRRRVGSGAQKEVQPNPQVEPMLRTVCNVCCGTVRNAGVSSANRHNSTSSVAVPATLPNPSGHGGIRGGPNNPCGQRNNQWKSGHQAGTMVRSIPQSGATGNRHLSHA